MDPEIDPEQRSMEIDPELWLRFLMDLSSKPKERAKLINRLSQNTPLSDEQIEEFLHLLMEELLDITRSN
ncbi:MAG: hypothetical protein IPF56_19035 [Chloroflexi bacterium]|nr:hypothetical protein [Chloroflexota bacterium]MBK6712955.1 hypothetical protein [Chloroflexota bacterium]MBK7918871.1 hypothetical protein [Chloroflexota bacterium]MBK8931950.1 hypothetical protein [Chloroflexota bacterium]MBP7593759.1 hypothetical protein [Chloroflexota bacterium]